MAEHAVCFIFLLTLLEVVVKTKMTIHGNSHGKKISKFSVLYVIVIVIFRYIPKIHHHSVLVSFASCHSFRLLYFRLCVVLFTWYVLLHFLK
jgi:hypothetical protein